MIVIIMETNVLHFLIINATTLIRELVNTTNNLDCYFLGIVFSTSQMHLWWK